MAVATAQLTGQLHHTPVSPSGTESAKDSATRMARSTKVSVMNSPMRPAPRSTPSQASLSATR